MGAEEGGGDYQKIPRPKIRRRAPPRMAIRDRMRAAVACPLLSFSVAKAIMLTMRTMKAKGMFNQFIQPSRGMRAIRNITKVIMLKINAAVLIGQYYNGVVWSAR